MLVVKIRSDPGLDLPTHRQSDCCRSRQAPGVSNLSTGKPPTRSCCFKSSLFAPSCKRPAPSRTSHPPRSANSRQQTDQRQTHWAIGSNQANSLESATYLHCVSLSGTIPLSPKLQLACKIRPFSPIALRFSPTNQPNPDLS